MVKKTVLVADDEKNVRHLIHRLLDEKYTVLEARDGQLAVDVTRNEKPDLILMDIFMPKMDGYTACCALKEDKATKAIPVIMITGEGLQLDRKLTLELGADGYMTKPLSSEELMDTIGRFLESRQ